VGSGADIAKSITASIDEATRAFSEADMLELGYLAQQIITLRTAKGIDADRIAFAPYSEAYYDAKYFAGKGRKHFEGNVAKRTAAEGRAGARVAKTATRFGAHSATHESALAKFMKAKKSTATATAKLGKYAAGATVDLTVTGHMQQAEMVSATANEAVIAFASPRQAAIADWINDGTKTKSGAVKMPKREWFDVRHPDEVAVMEEAIGTKIHGRIEKIR
jgi:phage gpG-like protein